jgi:DnaA family protein
MQLPLPVRLADEASFANFFPHPPVAAAVAQLRAALAGAGAGVLLHGPAGSGRSHLLQACCHEAEARGEAIVYLPLAELLELPPAELLAGLEEARLVCLDDLDVVAGRAAWDEALFHLLNRLVPARAQVLIAARLPPAALPPMLPDLRSRLQALLVLALAAADERAMLEVLRLRARNRGLAMSPEVARYILQRAPRDMAALIEVLERLDLRSLEAGRRLSIPFVREVMEWQG